MSIVSRRRLADPSCGVWVLVLIPKILYPYRNWETAYRNVKRCDFLFLLCNDQEIQYKKSQITSFAAKRKTQVPPAFP